MAYNNFPTNLEGSSGLKYYFTCEESTNKPYCAGSHERENTGKFSKEFVIKEDWRVATFDCGKTGNSPFCDGIHSK